MVAGFILDFVLDVPTKRNIILFFQKVHLNGTVLKLVIVGSIRNIVLGIFGIFNVTVIGIGKVVVIVVGIVFIKLIGIVQVIFGKLFLEVLGIVQSLIVIGIVDGGMRIVRVLFIFGSGTTVTKLIIVVAGKLIPEVKILMIVSIIIIEV